jgi:hypothetical protein
MPDDVYVLNQGLRSKTSKSGKTRFSIRVEAEPVIINTNAKALGAEITAAVVEHLRNRVRNISATVSEATRRARERAERAVQRGESWATKRYAGGKMGARQPNQSDRLFNDSGRFAESIVGSAASDNSWRINVAANRLDPQTANGGEAAVQRIWQRLVQLVPEFGDMSKLMQSNEILAARIRMVDKMISKGRKTDGEATAWDVAKAVGGLVKQAATQINSALAG